MASKDEDFETAQRGATSGMLLEQMEQRIAERERAIHKRAMGEWFGRTLTGDDARAYWAAIAELRGLLTELQADVRKGQDARNRLIAQPITGQR